MIDSSSNGKHGMGATNEEYFVQCIDFRLVVQLNPSDLMIGTLVIKQPNKTDDKESTGAIKRKVA